MVINRYAAALLSILVTLVAAFAAIPADQFDATAAVQLGILAAGAVTTFFVPLVDGKWKGLLKTGAAVAAALLTAVVPLLSGAGLDATNLAVVVLAGLNALAVEVGVQIRQDTPAVAATRVTVR